MSPSSTCRSIREVARRNGSVLRCLLAAIGCAALVGLGAAGAAGAAGAGVARSGRGSPTLLTGWYACYEVRPSSIYYTGDGSGVVGVLRRGGGLAGPGRGFLSWKRWRPQRAVAVGAVWIKLRSPTATSPFTRFSVTVDAYRMRNRHFTRMTLHYRLRGRRVSDTRCVPDRRRVPAWGLVFRGRCE